MTLGLSKDKTIKCGFPRFLFKELVDANLKGGDGYKKYMIVGLVLTQIAYHALGMIDGLPLAQTQLELIQHANHHVKNQSKGSQPLCQRK